MASTEVFAHSEKNVEVWNVGATLASGVPVVGGASGAQPGITLTATGDYTVSMPVGPYTISGIPRGGIGLAAQQASVATDGTWEIAVTGAASNIAQGALVYYAGANALTLTAATNKVYGKVNYPVGYVYQTGKLPVKIGVFA